MASRALTPKRTTAPRKRHYRDRVPAALVVPRAVAIIRQDFGRKLLLPEVAFKCGVPAYQLCRLFERALGISPREFLMYTRISAAKVLLQKSAFQMREIGAKCGFPSKSAFSEKFRKRTGMTPKEYRRSVSLS